MKNGLVLRVVRIFLICVMFLSCDENKEKFPHFPLEFPDILSEDVYEIYSAVSEVSFPSQKILIDQQTLTSPSIHVRPYSHQYEYLVNTFSSIDTIMLNNFQKVNEKNGILGSNFTNKSGEIILIAREEFFYYWLDLSSFNILFDKHKGAEKIVRFTQIGFNEEKTQAIFEMQTHIDSLSSVGTFIYLAKVNGEWEIISSGETYRG